MSAKRTVLVTGASSGLGASLAHMFAAAGFDVYGGARREFSCQGVTSLSLDVTDPASVTAALNAIIERSGGIDIVVNCAGTGIGGAVECTPPEAYRYQLEVNLFGTIEVCRQAVPYLRQRGGGTIINVGSVAYDFPIPFQAFYSASKAAINSFSGALRNEVRDFNIKVACVHPGDTKTGFTAGRVKYTDGNEAYNGLDTRSVQRMEHDEMNGMSADVCAAAIYRKAVAANPKPVSAVGFQYKLFLAIHRLLPERLLSWLLYLMYCPKK